MLELKLAGFTLETSDPKQLEVYHEIKKVEDQDTHVVIIWHAGGYDSANVMCISNASDLTEWMLAAVLHAQSEEKVKKMTMTLDDILSNVVTIPKPSEEVKEIGEVLQNVCSKFPEDKVEPLSFNPWPKKEDIKPTLIDDEKETIFWREQNGF